MNPTATGDSCLEVQYDQERDILYMLIPGRKIKTSGEVAAPLIVDFGSEEDGFDVVGLELHRASRYLGPLFQQNDFPSREQD